MSLKALQLWEMSCRPWGCSLLTCTAAQGADTGKEHAWGWSLCTELLSRSTVPINLFVKDDDAHSPRLVLSASCASPWVGRGPQNPNLTYLYEDCLFGFLDILICRAVYLSEAVNLCFCLSRLRTLYVARTVLVRSLLIWAKPLQKDLGRLRLSLSLLEFDSNSLF